MPCSSSLGELHVRIFGDVEMPCSRRVIPKLRQAQLLRKTIDPTREFQFWAEQSVSL